MKGFIHMATEKKTILRTVRIEPSMDKELQQIAENENRTVSNTIYYLLNLGFDSYIAQKNQLALIEDLKLEDLQNLKK